MCLYVCGFPNLFCWWIKSYSFHLCWSPSWRKRICSFTISEEKFLFSIGLSNHKETDASSCSLLEAFQYFSFILGVKLSSFCHMKDDESVFIVMINMLFTCMVNGNHHYAIS